MRSVRSRNEATIGGGVPEVGKREGGEALSWQSSKRSSTRPATFTVYGEAELYSDLKVLTKVRSIPYDVGVTGENIADQKRGLTLSNSQSLPPL